MYYASNYSLSLTLSLFNYNFLSFSFELVFSQTVIVYKSRLVLHFGTTLRHLMDNIYANIFFVRSSREKKIATTKMPKSK